MKSIDEIAADIEAAKTAEPLLIGLTSSSNASVWFGIKQVIATITYGVYQAMNSHKSEIENILKIGRFGTLAWLENEAKKWQIGDALIVDPTNYTYNYNLIDVTKQLVKYARAVEVGNSVVLRIAKTGKIKLTTIELTSFTTYLNRIKVPGQQIDVVSANADNLSYDVTVYYDGTLLANVVQLAVFEEARLFLENLTNGVFLQSEFEDVLRNTSGVKDVVLNSLNYQIDGSLVWLPLNRKYDSYSGTIEQVAIGLGVNDVKISMIAE